MTSRSILFPLFKGRPNLDRACCSLFLKNRLQLPSLSLSAYFPTFSERAVELYDIPRGGWSTPLNDVVMLLKVLVNTQPNRLMEVGSFRGYTALLMAQHMSSEASLVTVDMNPEHGEAYRNTPHADRIERRVGETGPPIFSNDDKGSYDFIFLDAGHRYHEVRHDTRLLLPLLAENGYFIWHDYANWGYFNEHNGVPEYLNELSASLPIAHIAGTDMAMHSPKWDTDGATPYKNALSGNGAEPEDVWTTNAPR